MRKLPEVGTSHTLNKYYVRHSKEMREISEAVNSLVDHVEALERMRDELAGGLRTIREDYENKTGKRSYTVEEIRSIYEAIPKIDRIQNLDHVPFFLDWLEKEES